MSDNTVREVKILRRQFFENLCLEHDYKIMIDDGQFDIVKRQLIKSGKQEQIFYYAVYSGDMEKINDYYRPEYKNGANAFNFAMYAGRIEILDWLLTNNFYYDLFTSDIAITTNNSELIRWCYRRGMPINFSEAIKCEDINLIELLWQYGVPLDSGNLVDAAEKENIIILNWLWERQCPYDDDIFNQVVGVTSNIRVLNWFYEKSAIPRFDDVYESAVRRGNIEVLNWMLTKDFQYSQEVFDVAIEFGLIVILDWLLDHNFPYNLRNITSQAIIHNVDISHWIQENMM